MDKLDLKEISANSPEVTAKLNKIVSREMESYGFQQKISKLINEEMEIIFRDKVEDMLLECLEEAIKESMSELISNNTSFVNLLNGSLSEVLESDWAKSYFKEDFKRALEGIIDDLEYSDMFETVEEACNNFVKSKFSELLLEGK